MNKFFTYIVLFAFSTTSFAQVAKSDDNQKMNLDAPTSNRFSIPQNLVWPNEIGKADVCLWNDDKLAAATITIDDNIENNHKWWLSMQDKYDISFTWFIIIGKVSSWDKYQTLIDAGNEIQTHDLAIAPVVHGDANSFSDEDYMRDITLARDTINKMLTNNQSYTFAYPYGKQRNYISRTKFVAMRGVTGLMNYANKINYLDVNSRSATNDPEDIRILLDPTHKLWNMVFYRGLASYHYHYVAYGSARTKTEAFLAELSAKSDSIWIGKFSEVTRYGQERDTHTLTVDEVGNTSIKFTLTDQMSDDYFDFPLTVKIRLDNTWEAVKAAQNGEDVETKIVENEGNIYALVKAIPDRGQVIVSKSEGLGINDVDASDINIYPNPVKGNEINISLSKSYSTNKTIDLYDIRGRTVYSSSIEIGTKTHHIYLKNPLTNGIYIVKIGSDSNIVTKKILVK